MHRNNNSFKFFLIVLLFLFGIASTSIFSQEKEESLKEKIKDIKGDVNKITIVTDKGTVEFEGKEAAELFKNLKAGTLHSGIGLFLDEFDVDKDGNRIIIGTDEGNVFHVFKKDEDENIAIGKSIIWNDEDEGEVIISGLGDDKNYKKIKIEDEDGNMKVTVTEKENDEEKTTEYEGKEAEEYIKKLKDEEGINIVDIDAEEGGVWILKDNVVKIGKEEGEHAFDIYLETEGEEGENIDKEVKVEVKDGEKTVTVTTTKNGEETIDVYKGEEADEYLDKLENEQGIGHIRMYDDKDGDNVMIFKSKSGKVKSFGSGKTYKIKVDKSGDKKSEKTIIIKKKTKKDDE